MDRVSFYIKKEFIDKKLESQLKGVAELMGEVTQLEQQKSKLQYEQDQMTEEQARLRENIAVLGNTSQEAALKEQYVKKLATQENRFETIKVEIEELEKKINQLNKKIEEQINEL
ncbi:MAG: hypothetical protein BAJALOKI1v1_2610003 [Promethearchaeota archaeon]|nr:MAG: hypothetical protein BAJALOKI1v1_2610003 [Candidatus Lokiarchaeota archaeon]